MPQRHTQILLTALLVASCGTPPQSAGARGESPDAGASMGHGADRQVVADAAGARAAREWVESTRAEPWPRPEPILQLSFTAADRPLEETLRTHLDAGRVGVERYFGRPMPETLNVTVHPDRAAFDGSFPAEWQIQTQCWMVAWAVADGLSLLSPRVWDPSCEHDGSDDAHVAEILAHEVVHTFHGQHNPTRDFTGAEELGWFAEGLAVLVSGQLHGDHAGAAAEALAAGAEPSDLASAHSGPWRYGVSGSIVAELERRVGRDGLFELLAATTNTELLERVGVGEAELLASWAERVRSDASDRPPVGNDTHADTEAREG